MVVARDRDDAEALERELELHRELGLDVTRLRPSQARALEPALAPSASASPSRCLTTTRSTRAASREALVRGGSWSGVELQAECEVAARSGSGVMLADGEQIAASRW